MNRILTFEFTDGKEVIPFSIKLPEKNAMEFLEEEDHNIERLKLILQKTFPERMITGLKITGNWLE